MPFVICSPLSSSAGSTNPPNTLQRRQSQAQAAKCLDCTSAAAQPHSVTTATDLWQSETGCPGWEDRQGLGLTSRLGTPRLPSSWVLFPTMCKGTSVQDIGLLSSHHCARGKGWFLGAANSCVFRSTQSEAESHLKLLMGSNSSELRCWHIEERNR